MSQKCQEDTFHWLSHHTLRIDLRSQRTPNQQPHNTVRTPQEMEGIEIKERC